MPLVILAHLTPGHTGGGGFDWLLWLSLAAAVWLYLRGWRRLPGVGDRRRRRTSFLVGVGILAVAVSAPMEDLADALFAAHMVQHLILLTIVPVLFVYGRAGRCITAGLPRRTLRTTGPIRRLVVRQFSRFDPVPLTAASFALVLWAWHIPALYDAAVLNEYVHGLEHLSMLTAAYALWTITMEARFGFLSRAVLVFVTAFQSGLLGAILVFARSPLYDVHFEQTLVDLDPLTDQQIAGATMWIAMGGAFLVALAALLIRQLDTPASEIVADG